MASTLVAPSAPEMRHGFDLTVRPPLRIRLYRLGPEHHVLFGVVHHIAGDGESMGILQRDLLIAYQARALGLVPECPSPATQFADYAIWLRHLLGPDTPVLEQQTRYWRTMLDGVPEQPVLPVDRPRAERRSNTAAAVPVLVDADTHRELARTALDCRVCWVACHWWAAASERSRRSRPVPGRRSG
ncbi:condensation domain-containing protein [Nocardia sp. NPDC004604]|uniref:condensation domain-containing protein n=1 Tax=Nocardia sp. NPDC004604 TaxID=3157013 RepID=UPI0033B0392F